MTITETPTTETPIIDQPAAEPPSEADQPPCEPTPPPTASPREPRRHTRRPVVMILLLALMIPTGWSYGGYLTAPGSDPVSVRSVEWLRDHGFATPVDAVEQWWYTRSPPTGSHPAMADIISFQPAATRSISPSGTTGTAVPVNSVIPAITRPSEPGEGVWQPVAGLTANGVDETFLRPDPTYPSVAVNLVRFDQHDTKLVYAPGTKQPGGTGWAWHSEIPRNVRPKAVAAFNAGFDFKDTPGGVFTEGRHAVRPLQNGLASLVISTDGTASIVEWGRDTHLTSHVATVRQNLDLIVDKGRPVKGLNGSQAGRWGTMQSQLQFTSRSGLGIDPQGHLIYAEGNDMTLAQLAKALSGAGAIRAMQLDIHHPVVSFTWYRPNPSSASRVNASMLVTSMHRNTTKYLTTSWRDFLIVVAR